MAMYAEPDMETTAIFAMDRARRACSARRASHGLHLAAAPVFAAMALATAIAPGAPMDVLCSASHGLTLGGMTVMYGLMSAFHAGPWLRMLAARKRKQDSAGRAAIPD
jgi:hypothetical protein